MLTVEEIMHVQRQGVHRKFLSLPLNFVANLKWLQKVSLMKKKYVEIKHFGNVRKSEEREKNTMLT